MFLSFLSKTDKLSDFLTLQDKHKIRTLSLNIKFICTRCENRPEKLAKGSLLCLFLKLVQINFIFTDNVRILYIYYLVRTIYLFCLHTVTISFHAHIILVIVHITRIWHACYIVVVYVVLVTYYNSVELCSVILTLDGFFLLCFFLYCISYIRAGLKPIGPIVPNWGPRLKTPVLELSTLKCT